MWKFCKILITTGTTKMWRITHWGCAEGGQSKRKLKALQVDKNIQHDNNGDPHNLSARKADKLQNQLPG